MTDSIKTNTQKSNTDTNNEKIKLEEVIKKLDSVGQELIPVPKPLTQEITAKIELIVKELTTLEKEILSKKEYVTEQVNIINKKIDNLIKTKKIKLNAKEREQSEKNIQHYIKLLDGVAKEIKQEMSYFSQFLSDKPPTQIVAPKVAQNNFGTYLQEKVRWANRYAKNIKKNIAISFSRYKFSFEEQLKKLDYMQNYLKSE